MHNASVMQHNLISKSTENYAFALAPLSLSLVYQPAKDAHTYLDPTAFHTQSPPNQPHGDLIPKISPSPRLIPKVHRKRQYQNSHQERRTILIMIPRRLPIPNTPASVDINGETVDERKGGDDRESACGEEGGMGGFRAEIYYEGGHGADIN
jgi:hypothetical protein